MCVHGLGILQLGNFSSFSNFTVSSEVRGSKFVIEPERHAKGLTVLHPARGLGHSTCTCLPTASESLFCRASFVQKSGRRCKQHSHRSDKLGLNSKEVILALLLGTGREYMRAQIRRTWGRPSSTALTLLKTTSRASSSEIVPGSTPRHSKAQSRKLRSRTSVRTNTSVGTDEWPVRHRE
jgi:hypothetical protein